MEELLREFASNYNVSWKDDQGNNWESDFLPIEEAAFLFTYLYICKVYIKVA